MDNVKNVDRALHDVPAFTGMFQHGFKVDVK